VIRLSKNVIFPDPENPQIRIVFVPKGAQHDQHPTNQAVVKLKTVPGA